ncbi:MAG: hydroxyethylthiazole kinase [Anaerolineae bacterium]
MSDRRWADQAAEALARLRDQRPLIHHITNFVVMNDTANVTLHIGGLPVMAHAKEEVAEMVEAAGALVLNPGTLTPAWVESMVLAGQRANARGIPVVLDPVGAGATHLRTEAAQRLLEDVRITIVRGNLGEISTLAGLGGAVKGVESLAGGADPLTVARTLTRHRSVTVAITGALDVVASGEQAVGVENGHPWLTTITGSGCMATTMVAAFAAVEPDPLLAAAAGLACFGIAAEEAAAIARGPGSFKVALMDALYHLTPEQVSAKARIRPLDES